MEQHAEVGDRVRMRRRRDLLRTKQSSSTAFSEEK
jgi:hypothetical protein